MRRLSLPALVAPLLIITACGAPAGTAGPIGPAARAGYRTEAPAFAGVRPLTRAERSGFTETSHYADVIAFVDSLAALAPIHVETIGTTTEGRRLPLVVASRPAVATPDEARRLGRPIVYVQANIHAGEVEGKEAIQALLRDLLRDPRPNVLDSIVLLAVPIYNADGNERFGPQARNRYEQNGPELVGQRPNGQDLDLNRDYVKAEAPETRASLAAFNRWNPDVFVDLHTTDGSLHGYALTYSPSLHPAAFFGGTYARDSMLPVLRTRMQARHAFPVFDYGNFVDQDSVEQGWFTYDHRARYGTNYFGLRGRIAILSEAYSHDPFPRRVASTYDFVSEILSLVSERAASIRALSADADARTTEWGAGLTTAPLVPLRAALPHTAPAADVLVEVLERTGTNERTEPGLPPGIRRTGRVRVAHIPVFDRFVPTLTQVLPAAYAFPPEVADSLVPRLRLHGLIVERLLAPFTVIAQSFVVDSIAHAARPFQGHNETRVSGAWSATAPLELPAAWYVVRTAQPLGVLAAILLSPESDDALASWNALDPFLHAGQAHPVVRIVQPLSARLGPVP